MIMMLALSLALQAFILGRSRRSDRPFQLVLLMSTAYFTVGGYFYWAIWRGTEFSGFMWGAERLERSAVVLALASALVSVVAAALSREPAPLGVTQQASARQAVGLEVADLTWPMGWAGIAASLYVLATGVSAEGIQRSPGLLVAYQFSDVLIPVTLYLLVSRGATKTSLAVAAYFLLYAAIVGFRYKMALLLGPVILLLLFGSHGITRGGARSRLAGAGLAVAAVLIFAALTVFRSKFSGLDFSKPIADPVEDALYGLFAETSLIYGLSSIITNYADASYYVYLEPVLDVVREWVPRFILPDRVTGIYLLQMQLGFITDHGIDSGTAYPYIGEFIAMGGWAGLVIGCLAYGMLYTRLKGAMDRYCPTPRHCLAGICLVAVMMGYYHYSRGYLPQVVKAYLFIVLPYIVLCGRTRPAARTQASMVVPT